MRMQILEAYCVQLRRNVNIYEANQAYFQQPEDERQKFDFRCSDKNCREQKNPLVTGANYTRLAEEGDKFQQMHFRGHAKHPHIPNCPWILAVEDDVQLLPSDEDTRVRISRAKETDVIDVFSPRKRDQEVPPPTGGKTPPPPEPESDGDDEHEGGDVTTPRQREGQSSTSLLERFIDCWSQLEGEELREHYINIEGQRLSYRQAVKHVSWLFPSENGKRIVSGGARVNKWPTVNPTRLYINFIDGCEKFDPQNEGKDLVIDLPISRIKQHRSAALILAKLAKAQEADHYLKVFAWGRIEPRGSKSGYKLEIDALENLVLKPIKANTRKGQAPD